MRLLPMTKSDYESWAPRSKSQYAKDKMIANNLTEKEAQEIANNDFERLLSDGLATRDNYLYTMSINPNIIVGYLWFRVQGPNENRKAFICDIIVEEQYRGKGYGRKAMQLVENEVKKLGLSEISLHVFGFNTTAINLYSSLGYNTTDLVMAKSIK